VITSCMVFHQDQDVAQFAFWVRKTALNEQARLGQGQRGSFF
jgi:hypothetical protein